MKKSLVLVLCFILFLSLTFVSAGFFEESFNKITGKAIIQKNLFDLFSKNDQEIVIDHIGNEVEYFDLGKIENLPQARIIPGKIKTSFIGKIFPLFEKNEGLAIGIEFENLPFEPEGLAITIHDVNTGNSWLFSSSIPYENPISFFMNASFLKFLEEKNINIYDSNLGILLQGQITGDLEISIAEDGFFNFKSSSFEGVKMGEDQLIIYVTKFQENIVVDGTNIRKIDLVSNYLNQSGLNKFSFIVKNLIGFEGSFICASPPCEYPFELIPEFFIGEGNSLVFPYSAEIQITLVGQEEIRTMTLMKFRNFLYPWKKDLFDVLMPRDFQEMNFKILNTFEPLFKNLNIGDDFGFFCEDFLPLDYRIRWNSFESGVINLDLNSYYGQGVSNSVSKTINLSKISSDFEVYNLLKKPLRLQLNHTFKEGVLVPEEILEGNLFDNELASEYGPFYIFNSNNYVYPGYTKITKPSGIVHENTKGGIGTWALNCGVKENSCDASSPDFPNFGFCEDGIYHVEWLYTNVSLGDTFFLEKTFRVKDCKFILKEVDID